MVAAIIDLKSSSDKVARIIKVIDEIAFQTSRCAPRRPQRIRLR